MREMNAVEVNEVSGAGVVAVVAVVAIAVGSAFASSIGKYYANYAMEEFMAGWNSVE